MKNIAITINTNKDKDGIILKSIINKLKTNLGDVNIEIYKDSIGINKYVLNKIDMVIAVGGDGTILRTARALSNNQKPILGVNIGHLGFLSGVEIEDLDDALIDIKNKKYHIEDRTMLMSSIEGKDKLYKYSALNDIVIAKGTLSRIVKYDIKIDGNFYTNFKSDGIIISTPTGSTGYSMSAGGPIIYPTLDLITITPICPHSFGMRTLVIDSKSKILIRIEKGIESVFLTVDGQESIDIGDIKEIIVKTHPCRCKLIKLDNYNYYKVLREKIISRTKECEGDN